MHLLIVASSTQLDFIIFSSEQSRFIDPFLQVRARLPQFRSKIHYQDCRDGRHQHARDFIVDQWNLTFFNLTFFNWRLPLVTSAATRQRRHQRLLPAV
jgi:hypothetical protein